MVAIPFYGAPAFSSCLRPRGGVLIGPPDCNPQRKAGSQDSAAGSLGTTNYPVRACALVPDVILLEVEGPHLAEWDRALLRDPFAFDRAIPPATLDPIYCNAEGRQLVYACPGVFARNADLVAAIPLSSSVSGLAFPLKHRILVQPSPV